jgi:outer membrane protein
MKPLKMMIVVAAASVLVSTPGYAQGAGAQQPPAKPPAAQPPATPPATPPPASQPPAVKPPAPFPEGAKVAFVNIQYVASLSAEGKTASGKLEALKKKKNDELIEKQKALQTAQTKLQQGGTVLSDQARAQLEKDIERMNRDMQFAQQDAQTEVNEETQKLQNDFQERLSPIVEALRVEKGLQLIFSVIDSGIVAADPGLDLSAEVVKRFDASAKPAPKK